LTNSWQVVTTALIPCVCGKLRFGDFRDLAVDKSLLRPRLQPPDRIEGANGQ
jgi:hypothetical protein